MHRILCTAVVLATVGAPPVGAGAEMAGGAAALPLSEVASGQRGFGLSVFSGHEPERFEVEVLGVWESVRPETSYVLARLSGRGLEESGVIAGMSGSPVFVGDRLLGAVAFAWPFAQQAVAGITPIGAMRKMAAIAPPPSAARRSAPVGLAEIAGAAPSPELLETALAPLQPRRPGAGSAALGWLASGFGPESEALLAARLGSVAAAGRSSRTETELAPGAAIAAVLVDGDLRLAASGTVTDRQGDMVLAFGHPFLGLGSLEVPMATAEVVTVVSSLANSFKITNLGPVVGAFDYDHAAGIRGRLGAMAPTIPMAIRLRGPGEQTLELRLAELEPVTPALVAVSLLGALDSATAAVGDHSLDLSADFDLGAAGKLQIVQSFDGPNARIEAALHLFSIVGYLLQNGLQEVELASVDVEIERHVEPRTLRLVGAHAARSLVRPGDSVVLNFDLKAFRGGPVRKSLALELPPNLPAGRYSLLVGDGVSVDAARLAIERFEPVSFDQALEFLRSLHSRRELVVLGVFAEPGLAVAGEVLPRLPASLRSLWNAAPSGGAKPLRLATAQQQRLQLASPVAGLVRVDLEVERRRPFAPPGSEAGGGGEGESGEAAEPPSGGGEGI